MSRALLSVRMAFGALVGILILFNAPFMIVRSINELLLARREHVDIAAQSGAVIGSVAGTFIGIALVMDAIRVRGRLKALDS